MKIAILIIALCMSVSGNPEECKQPEPGDKGSYVEFSMDNAPEGNATIAIKNWLIEEDNARRNQ